MTANSHNVVEFPGYAFPAADPGDPTSLDQVQERIDSIRDVFIEAAVETIVSCCMEAIGAAGFEQDVDDMDQVKDTALVGAAIKSLIMRTRDMTHPLQTVAEEMFRVTRDDEGYFYVEANT